MLFKFFNIAMIILQYSQFQFPEFKIFDEILPYVERDSTTNAIININLPMSGLNFFQVKLKNYDSILIQIDIYLTSDFGSSPSYGNILHSYKFRKTEHSDYEINLFRKYVSRRDSITNAYSTYLKDAKKRIIMYSDSTLKQFMQVKDVEQILEFTCWGKPKPDNKYDMDILESKTIFNGFTITTWKISNHPTVLIDIENAGTNKYVGDISKMKANHQKIITETDKHVELLNSELNNLSPGTYETEQQK